MATKKKVFRRRMRKKLTIVFFVFMAAFLAIIVRIGYINVKKGEQYERQVLSQQKYDSITLPYRRGDILDCNGTTLATSIKVYNMVLEPYNILDTEEKKNATIAALVQYFDISEEEINEQINNNKDSLYRVVLKKLSYEQVEPFKEFLETSEAKNVVGVWFEEEYQRFYPNDTMACHVLGFTSSGNAGNWGIEQYYNEELNGIDGREYGYLNENMELERTVKSPENGYTIVTTIDANIQNIVENEIQKFMDDTGALNVSVVAMNPNNGEIYAMANSNKFNLNEPYDISCMKYQFKEHIPTESNYGKTTEGEPAEGSTGENTQEIDMQAIWDGLSDQEKEDAYYKLWRNYSISDTFEPGSTYKTFTIAGGLEEDILKGNETYFCDGRQVIAGIPISCHKTSGHGEITLEQALAYSCNDALMQIGEAEGPDIFAQYQTVFGFGYKTNIDLPGEAYTSTLIYNADTLGPAELATCSFGQGQNVSMIQLATAFCSVVNGGDFYQPHIVKQIINEDGGVVKNIDEILVRKTISVETSETLKQYLFQVVESGTGKKAQVEGYTIGGKTGTAEKQPRGYENYVISFIGFAPVEKPEIVIYVTVDEPDVIDQSNSGVASIIAQQIFEQVLPYMNVNQSNSEEESTGEDVGDEAAVPVEMTSEENQEPSTEGTSENQEPSTAEPN